mmetsp:Transcript_40005/g.93412  ORF Transcript_40005/g.93412 Transcript_40005/m.93412 type:complete len:183 (-) Transcript_40005:698-1246(-)
MGSLHLLSRFGCFDSVRRGQDPFAAVLEESFLRGNVACSSKHHASEQATRLCYPELVRAVAIDICLQRLLAPSKPLNASRSTVHQKRSHGGDDSGSPLALHGFSMCSTWISGRRASTQKLSRHGKNSMLKHPSGEGEAGDSKPPQAKSKCLIQSAHSKGNVHNHRDHQQRYAQQLGNEPTSF